MNLKYLKHIKVLQRSTVKAKYHVTMNLIPESRNINRFLLFYLFVSKVSSIQSFLSNQIRHLALAKTTVSTPMPIAETMVEEATVPIEFTAIKPETDSLLWASAFSFTK